jgi:hypothetical protein
MTQVSSQSEPWQRRRSRLSHDWLKNTFIIQLGALINLVFAKQCAEIELIEACQRALREWDKHKIECRELIESFRFEESPMALFDIPPLANCNHETKSWLPAYIHQHWLETHPVESWIQNALTAWMNADLQTDRLRAAIKQSQSGTQVLEALVSDLRNSVIVLSDAISRFPNRQLI